MIGLLISHETSQLLWHLCREVLDDGPLPEGDQDWTRLRQSFDIQQGQSIGNTISRWDDQCRFGDFDIEDQNSFVKLGIVTWTVKLLLKKLGMLTGPPAPEQSLEEWKTSLISCLDKYILIGARR